MVLRRQAKVGELDGPAIVHHKDVLRLEVPVVDSARVAVLDSRNNLQKYISGLHVVTNILTLLGDLGKKVTFGAVLKHDIRAIRALQGLMQGHDVRMLALVVELNLTILESPLTVVKTNLWQSLYSILDVGQEIPGLVYGAIGTNAEDVG